MPAKFFFQYKQFVPGMEHPAVYLLSANFKNAERAKQWADKMQTEAREGLSKGPLPTFKIIPATWKRPKNLKIPQNTNVGQATIGSIRKLSLQRAR